VYDSGNMLLTGENPVEYYEKVAHRTAHIHLKDMRMAGPTEKNADISENGQRFCIAPTGTGLVDIEAVIQKCKSLGYDGWYTLEYSQHPGVDRKTSLVRSREYIEKLM
ncbi:MAG: sugar phosphate isomerase/epimerase, partial [Oscillospiraceae bacterium]|nr:sugar phosphate isomerase/epimerase [Oscillospiraceae bacterium]